MDQGSIISLLEARILAKVVAWTFSHYTISYITFLGWAQLFKLQCFSVFILTLKLSFFWNIFQPLNLHVVYMHNLALIFKTLLDGVAHPECKDLLRASICWLTHFPIWCSGWTDLRLYYLKLWKERFKNPLFIIWAISYFLQKVNLCLLSERSRLLLKYECISIFTTHLMQLFVPLDHWRNQDERKPLIPMSKIVVTRNNQVKIVLQNNQCNFSLLQALIREQVTGNYLFCLHPYTHNQVYLFSFLTIFKELFYTLDTYFPSLYLFLSTPPSFLSNLTPLDLSRFQLHYRKAYKQLQLSKMKRVALIVDIQVENEWLFIVVMLERFLYFEFDLFLSNSKVLLLCPRR